jgi:nucleoside triphosphate pyrophosphatase
VSGPGAREPEPPVAADWPGDLAGRNAASRPLAGEGPLILASASPRRREILASLGIPFEVVVPDVAEVAEGDPEAVVLENARRKARAGLEATGKRAATLGVDTEVVLGGRTLGKAADPQAARARLEALSGRTHVVLSGIVLIEPDDEARGERSAVARSEVTFRDLDRVTLDLYLASGEWRGRAGAYAIQGLGSILIARIAGDFSNVVGLPIRALLDLTPALFHLPRLDPGETAQNPNP